MKVLVLDGHRDILQILSSQLRLLGHEVDDVSDGREAIRRLHLSHFDIVITNSEITSIDGPEICKFVKSHFPDIYVIGMSGYLSALKDLEEAGADICLSKPFCLDELKKAIECRPI